MLEEKVERLTSEIIKLREAIEKNGGGSAGKADAGEKADGKKTTAKKSKHTPEAVKAAVIKLKDDKSQDDAKALIASFDAKNLADLCTMTAKFDAIMAKVEEMLAADDGDEDEDGDEL